MTRTEAYELLTKYVKGETLIRHSLTVEGVMRHWAAYLHEDVEYWGNIGLLHDIDFELYPQEHCVKAREILEQEKIPEDIIHAILSHGWGLVSDVEPHLNMEKVLYAIDELTGLIFATALMRPSKSVQDLEAKSVMKKYKTPQFAANCNREVIKKGADLIEMELTDVIHQTILGMRLLDPSSIGLQ